MKNFPHQFSSLTKLTDALRIVGALLDLDAAVGDDAVLGEAMARHGLYVFRGAQDSSIDELMEEERKKPASQQGTRTAAREMRRFLAMCGFIWEEGDIWSLTSTGIELLNSTSAEVASTIWREALLNLSLSDSAGHISHPYRLLLRLVSDFPGIEIRKLMLAFEAKDDSANEYARISGLVEREFDDLLDELGIGRANAANAVKILPSIADQLRDITRAGGQAFPLAPSIVAEDGPEQLSPPRATKPTAAPKPGKAVTAASIAAQPRFTAVNAAIKDMTAAMELQRRRTERHQALIQKLAAFLAERGYALFENPFDCLAVRDSRALLVEGKTLDGSPADERRQAEKALGQILGYRHFDMPDEAPSDVSLVVAFSQRPTDEMVLFLAAQNLVVVWPDKEQWSTLDSSGNVCPFEP